MRGFRVIAVGLLMSFLVVSQCLGATPSVQKLNENARIDWTNLVYIATGEGAMPSSKEEPNRGRAFLKAKGYARMAAIANLLAAIEGTAISFDAIGKDYMENAVIRQKIEGYVRNVEVTRTTEQKMEGDTIVVVEVRAPLYGQSGPGAALLAQELSQPSDEGKVKVTLTPDVAVTRPATEAPKPAAPAKPYTSVIIDTTGYKLDRCMSPKIRRTDGSEVWGSVKAPMELVIDRGICSYVTSLEAGKANARCGSNPLIIKAIGRAGGRFNSDPVISNRDADLLVAENARSGFLDKLNVIIVKDGRL